jgi:hypothetical protein
MMMILLVTMMMSDADNNDQYALTKELQKFISLTHLFIFLSKVSDENGDIILDLIM